MPPAPRDDKPQAVIHATRILWVWTILSFVYGVYSKWADLQNIDHMITDQTQAMHDMMLIEPDFSLQSVLNIYTIITVYALLSAGAAWVIWKIGAGKNWARLSLLLSFILDVLWTVIPPYHGVPYFLAATLDLGAQIAALYLLYTWPGRAWFLPPGTTAA
jgi:hypothetical protein